jgi:hypothetical protein
MSTTRPNRLRRVTAVAQALSKPSPLNPNSRIKPPPVAPAPEPIKAKKAPSVPPRDIPGRAKQALVIRRAIFTDATNIYKALVEDEHRRRIVTNNDDTARVAFILTTIATGFVIVVETSGRICGAIGFASGGAPYAKQNTLLAVFSFMIASFQREEIVDRVAAMLTAFADEHKVAISLTVDNPDIGDMWEEFGFEPKGVLLVREYSPARATEPEEDAEYDESDESDWAEAPDETPTVSSTGGSEEFDDVDSELADDEL